MPYVIAVSERPFSIGDESWHRTNVLFGQEAVEYSAGRPVRTVYLPDASGAGHVQGREIPDWQWCSLPALDALDRRSDELEWWDNPFADQPVPYDVIPEVADRCQLVVDDMGVGHLSKTEARRALGSVFDC